MAGPGRRHQQEEVPSPAPRSTAWQARGREWGGSQRGRAVEGVPDGCRPPSPQKRHWQEDPRGQLPRPVLGQLTVSRLALTGTCWLLQGLSKTTVSFSISLWPLQISPTDLSTTCEEEAPPQEAGQVRAHSPVSRAWVPAQGRARVALLMPGERPARQTLLCTSRRKRLHGASRIGRCLESRLFLLLFEASYVNSSPCYFKTTQNKL